MKMTAVDLWSYVNWKNEWCKTKTYLIPDGMTRSCCDFWEPRSLTWINHFEWYQSSMMLASILDYKCFFLNSVPQIQKYFKMKSESPDLFRVSPVSEMHDLLKMQMQQVLPQLDNNGSVVYIFRVREYWKMLKCCWMFLILFRRAHDLMNNFFIFRKLWSIQMSSGKCVS